jgi:uncharacterized protein YndB with AHSA1/START domain
MHEPLVLRQQYKLSRPRLYALLSTPLHMEAWFSPSDDIPVKVLQHDFRVGGEYKLQYAEPGGGHVIVAGKFVQIEAPRLISFTWEWQQGDIHTAIPTVVTWLLNENDTGTEFTVLHERMPDKDYFERHKGGWLGALQRLQDLSVQTSEISP